MSLNLGQFNLRPQATETPFPCLQGLILGSLRTPASDLQNDLRDSLLPRELSLPVLPQDPVEETRPEPGAQRAQRARTTGPSYYFHGELLPPRLSLYNS